jgi:hypothetical protein
LVLVLISSISFFAWGARTPLLDSVWRLQTELRLGRRPPLSSAELALFQRALCEHPAIVEEGLISANHQGLIENGYAYAVVKKSTVLAVSLPGSVPIADVRVRTVDARAEGAPRADRPFEWTVPRSKSCPTLIEVRMKQAARVELR